MQQSDQKNGEKSCSFAKGRRCGESFGKISAESDGGGGIGGRKTHDEGYPARNFTHRRCIKFP